MSKESYWKQLELGHAKPRAKHEFSKDVSVSHVHSELYRKQKKKIMKSFQNQIVKNEEILA